MNNSITLPSIVLISAAKRSYSLVSTYPRNTRFSFSARRKHREPGFTEKAKCYVEIVFLVIGSTCVGRAQGRKTTIPPLFVTFVKGQLFQYWKELMPHFRTLANNMTAEYAFNI